MSNYAKVENGKVTKVLVISDNDVEKRLDKSLLVKTSYNTVGGIYYNPITRKVDVDQTKALRKNYAGIGYTYDAQRDAFIPPKPYPSWTLDESSCLWKAPVEMPTDNKRYNWNESTKKWEVTNG